MPSPRDIAELGSVILGFTPLAPFKPIADGVIGLLPDDDDDTKKNKELAWKIQHIPQWKEMCKKLMDIPMANFRKAEVLKGKIRSDFFLFYGEMPKDRWVDTLHANVYDAVVADLSVIGIS
jgi:hypothetical protein